MATVLDLISRTQRHLYGMHKDILNVLDGAVDASVTAVTMTDALNGVAPGNIIAIDDELMYVRSANIAGRILSVLRGFRGTTAAAHADDSIVEISPRFPKPYLRDLLKEEILSWPEGLFRVMSVPLSLAGSQRGYDLTGVPSNHFGIVGFHLSPASGETGGGWSGGPTTFRLERNLPAADFPSTSGLILTEGYAGRDAYVDVAVPFDVDPFVDATTTASIGLEDSMLDIAPMGVAWRVLAAREAKRTFTESQGEPLDYEAVPPMFQMQAAERYKRMRDSRIGDEAMKLRGRYPLRML